MAYSYMDSIKKDIRTYIKDNDIDVTSEFDDRDEAREKLDEDLWVEDSVTGNASGMYSGSDSDKNASEMVGDNIDLLLDALRDFGDIHSGKEFDRYNLFNTDDREYMPVEYLSDMDKADLTIRCYLLGTALGEVLEEDYDDDDFDKDDEEEESEK